MGEPSITQSTWVSRLVHSPSTEDTCSGPTFSPQGSPRPQICSTLVFLRSSNVEQVRRAGQWSSSASFIQRYLQPHLFLMSRLKGFRTNPTVPNPSSRPPVWELLPVTYIQILLPSPLWVRSLYTVENNPPLFHITELYTVYTCGFDIIYI